MTETTILDARARFTAAIAIATTPDAAYVALQDLARAVVGAKLFTIMDVDMDNEVARRSFTSDPQSYPTSGTKPIHYDDWFDIVHKARRTFVANTIADIAAVFPDYELIDSLGCQSVINLPVILGDVLVATVNMLDVEGHYTPERVALAEEELALPAMLVLALEKALA